MIDRIDIQNYKSIEKLSLDLGRVTVLIGANGSGKSNILEAIALCSAAAANKLDNEFLFSRGIRVSDDLRFMFPAFDKSSEDVINVALFNGEEELLSVIIEKRADKKQLEAIDSALALHILENAKDKDVSTFYNGLQSLYRELKNKYEQIGIISFLPFSAENSALRRFEEEGQIQPLGIRGEGLFKLLTVLARDENRDRLNEIQERLQLLDWFGDFQIGGNVALGERTLRIRDQYLDGDLAYFTQRSANEGFLFLLFYFTLFVAKETPRFFAIDNIDASLNPKLCAELLRQLTELAEKYDKQVILTTHNPAVLDGLNLHDDNQKLYVVERDLDGRTQARQVPPPRPPEKHEEPVPLSEAFLRGYIGGLPKNF